MYEVLFKKNPGFHTETFEASSDDEARVIVRALQNKALQDGEKFCMPLSLKKTVSLR